MTGNASVLRSYLLDVRLNLDIKNKIWYPHRVTAQQTIGRANAFRKKQLAGCFLAGSSRIVKSGGPETEFLSKIWLLMSRMTWIWRSRPSRLSSNLTGMKSKIKVGEVQVERLDDIPVIFGHLQKIHIQAIIDQVIEPHGNWQGQSPGWVIAVWLMHILSEHTHCMDRVQDWVAKRLHALRELTGQELTELDFSDNRLALCLRMLSQTDHWHEIKALLGRHLLRVYCLGERPTVRLDATTGTVNHDPDSHTLFLLLLPVDSQVHYQVTPQSIIHEEVS